MQWYSQIKAAAIIDIDPDELGRIALAGKIRFALVGKRRKFSETDIKEFMTKCYDAAAEVLAPRPKKGNKKVEKPNQPVDFMAARRARKARG